MSKPKLFNTSFILNDSQEKFYFLRLMASDGNICQNNRSFSFSQSHNKGLNLIKYLCEKLKYPNKISKSKNSYKIWLTSEEAVVELNKYNIVPNKTINYQFPMNINKNYILSFIRGYFDGDGSIGVYKNNIGTPYLCASIVGTKDFIEKLLLYIPCKGNILEIKRCKNLYEIRWNGKQAVIFCEWLFENNDLYKSSKYLIYKKYISNRNDKYTKYNPIKEECKKLYNLGYNPHQIWNMIGKKTNYQTIYTWRNNGFFD